MPLRALPAIKHLPDGVKRYDTGDAELLTEMFSSFSMAMITGVLLVFAVLVLLFRTVVQPITIMAALPLSIGGALLALLISPCKLIFTSSDWYAHAHGHCWQKRHSAG